MHCADMLAWLILNQLRLLYRMLPGQACLFTLPFMDVWACQEQATEKADAELATAAALGYACTLPGHACVCSSWC